MRVGARSDATKRKPGRPKAEPTTPVMLRLTEVQRINYLERGGARWIKRLINEALLRDNGK